MGRAARRWALVGLAAGASCGFGSDGDTTGAMLGSGPSSPDGGTTAADGSGASDDATVTGDGTGGMMTGVGSITSPTSGPAEDSGADSSGDGSMETTGGTTVDPCANPPAETYQFDLSFATLSPDIQTGTHGTWGQYGYSVTPNAGVISFPFTVACPAVFRAFAFVYDDEPLGVDISQADSLRAKVDNGNYKLWAYGCQPLVGGWGWREVRDNGALCQGGAMSWTLSAGSHAIHFQNVEGGSAGNNGDDPGNVAALAHVIVTSDPAFTP
mgnify:CR=1 FL=1